MDWNSFQEQNQKLHLPKGVLTDLNKYCLIQYLEDGFDQITAEALIFLAKEGKISYLKGHYDKETCLALITLIKHGIPLPEVSEKSPAPIIYIIQQQQASPSEDESPPGWVWLIAGLLVAIALSTIVLAGSPELLSPIQSFLTTINP